MLCFPLSKYRIESQVAILGRSGRAMAIENIKFCVFLLISAMVNLGPALLETDG